MDKNKLILPISILLGCIILGGFYYVSEMNKNKSIGKQQQLDLQARTEQQTRDYIAKRKEDCLTIYKTEAAKWNNVQSWDYIEPSTNRFSLDSDTCEVWYKGTDGKLFSNTF